MAYAQDKIDEQSELYAHEIEPGGREVSRHTSFAFLRLPSETEDLARLQVVVVGGGEYVRDNGTCAIGKVRVLVGAFVQLLHN